MRRPAGRRASANGGRGSCTRGPPARPCCRTGQASPRRGESSRCGGGWRPMVSPWPGAARRPGDGGGGRGRGGGSGERGGRSAGSAATAPPGGPAGPPGAASEEQRRHSSFCEFIGFRTKSLWLKFASLGGAATGEVSFWAVKQYFRLRGKMKQYWEDRRLEMFQTLKKGERWKRIGCSNQLHLIENKHFSVGRLYIRICQEVLQC